MNKREIKFRAWDKNRKVMIIINDNRAYVDFGGKVHAIEVISGNYVCPNWTLMQYTGLKDKNGKEIYEGDILQSTPNGYEPRPLFKIIWDESECRFEAVFRDSVNGSWELKRHIVDIQYMKIIGNIYENPDLLK